MTINDYNKKTIIDIYKNIHIALQSISNILPSVENDSLKKELKSEYEEYEKLISEISSFLKENKIEYSDINILKKAMLWSSIKIKTAFNNSKNQITEMMIKGTVMGLIELIAMENEKKNLNQNILEFLNKAIILEGKFEERLKNYL